MKIGILLGAEIDHAILTSVAQSIEAQKFHSVWCGEAPPKCEFPITGTLLGLATKKIPMGCAVTNPYLRHPVKTAVSLAKVNLICNNRLILGLGAGSQEALKNMGLDWDRPVKYCREAIEVIRQTLTGKPVYFEGETVSVKGYRMDYAPQTPPPIYIGCRRPKMLQMAGEVADGVVLDNVPIEYMPFAKQQIKKGKKRYQGTKKKFCIANITTFAVDENSDIAKDKVRSMLPIDFITISRRELESVKLGLEDIQSIQAILHNQNKERLREASALVTDYMLDKFSVSGTPEECIARIRSFEKSGVELLILCIPMTNYSDLQGMVEITAKEILPWV